MVFGIFIEPHERADALEAYGTWLSPDQVDEIMDAPETALISLRRDANGTTVQIVEEG